MKLETKIEDFQFVSTDLTVPPRKTERSATTTVVVADNDTIVFGGLTRDKETATTTKIPILGDIPLLGWLFRSRSSEVKKTNLLVFLTPRVIRDYERSRTILDKKLKERDDFIERHAGGDDNNRDRKSTRLNSSH